jgi:hypothetical protein
MNDEAKNKSQACPDPDRLESVVECLEGLALAAPTDPLAMPTPGELFVGSLRGLLGPSSAGRGLGLALLVVYFLRLKAAGDEQVAPHERVALTSLFALDEEAVREADRLADTLLARRGDI